MKTALLLVFCFDALAENAFMLLYGLRSPWRSTPFGRMMFTYSAAVAGIMDLAILSIWWRPSPWILLGGYVLFGLTLTHRLVLLLRTQRKGAER